MTGFVLKSCPFCGSDAVLTPLEPLIEGNWAVECQRCTASVGGTDEEDAVMNWNLRSGSMREARDAVT